MEEKRAAERGRPRPACNDESVSARDNRRRSYLRSFLDELEVPKGGFTVADLHAMPESHHRIELTDGALTLSPSASSTHQFMAMMLAARLYEQRTEGFTVNQAVDVELTHNTTRIPDVVVLWRPDKSRRWYKGSEVVVAVEIESPTNYRDDRTLKPELYAEAGIPHYWRIELEPELVAVRYRLEQTTYVQDARGPRIDVTEPFPFAIDLADLVDPDA
jgi:Uma2 family endonuclease